MHAELLERDTELGVLDAAVAAAIGGGGSVVLLSGEAGIGKTSVLRAFVRTVSGAARVLFGACDDLLTPRTFGPLRDAVGGPVGGPLAAVLRDGDRDGVLSETLALLSGRPTVLIVEDVHWADDATLDVLRFVGRRIADLPAVLVLSYRDDEIGRDHPLQRVLGALSGEGVHRLRLPRLSRTAVAQLAGGTAATSAPLFALTEGNPFFVTEAIAAPGDVVPATVVDAVLARVHRLAGPTRAALEQLSVVPNRVELGEARALLGDLSPLAEAERTGMVEVGQSSVGFRHELARRAVEGALPVSIRMQLNARVLAALFDRDGTDPARLAHHAVEAGNEEMILAHVPEAALRASEAGAYGQAVVLYEQALSRSGLAAAERAAMCQARATALFTLDRMDQVYDAALEAVRIRQRLGEPVALGEALIGLATVEWVVIGPRAATDTAEQAAHLLDSGGDSPQRTWALAYLALLRTSVDEDAAAQHAAEAATTMAARLGVPALQAFALLARGTARMRLGDGEGIADLHAGVRTAAALPQHAYVVMGHVLLAQELWHAGRFEEVEQYVDEGLAYAHERDVSLYVDGLHAFRYRLQALRGNWTAAEIGLRRLVGEPSAASAGSLNYSLPHLPRLLVRAGVTDAPEVLVRAREYAPPGRDRLVPVLLAQTEQAWLAERPDDARDAIAALTASATGPGSERRRGELLRWRQRLGEEVAPSAGCPQEFAAGIRGDWRQAAAEWERIGAPYERALELLDSNEVDPIVEALGVFDELGAAPAARIARRRLRALGVRQVPRGPQPATRANPAGLTDRQAEILRLLTDGLTNAEIAERLVVSVRTVDHHVSAVLQKLGVASRRAAAAAAEQLRLDSAR
jgi:DNA-binding CsgD family transcriptional regulator